MPASAEFYEDLTKSLLAASEKNNTKLLNELLDFWNDRANLATDYDGYEWGFDPETWCRHHRNVMEDRISSLTETNTVEMP